MAAALVMRQPTALRVLTTVLLAAFALMLSGAAFVAGGLLSWLSPLAVVLGPVVTMRNWRMRLDVSGDGLVIANLARTYILEWSQVDRVVDSGGVRVRLHSGREIGVSGVSAFTDVPGPLPSVRSRNAGAALQIQAVVKRYRRR